MDNTFHPVHINDYESLAIVRRSNVPYKRHKVMVINDAHANHFFLTKAFKKIADKKVKKLATSTVKKFEKKSGTQIKTKDGQVLTAAQYGERFKTLAKPVTTKAAKSATMFTLGTLAAAGGFAAAPLFAGKAAAAGASAIGAKTAAGATAAKAGGAIAAGGAAAKKTGVLDKLKTIGTSKLSELKDTKTGKAVQELIDRVPESVKQNLKDKGKQAVQKFLNGEQTSPELLPKTRPQKQLEATIQGNSGQILSMNLLREPLVIAAIVLLVIGVIVSIVRK